RDVLYGGSSAATPACQPRRRATRTATSSGSSNTAVAVSPASCHAPHNGPSLRRAIAEVGHSSETNSSSAPPPAVRPATVTSAGPSPRPDRAGARSGAPTRLRSLSVICLRYHSRHGLRKGAAAALYASPCTREGL